MKLLSSYFYQIRNFPENYVPLSTVIWDPRWFHKNLYQQYEFIDKRGILNGLRWELVVPKMILNECPCSKKDEYNGKSQPPCQYLHEYKCYLKSLDSEEVWKDLLNFKLKIKKALHLKYDTLQLVLMFHEKEGNPCSERNVLIPYLRSIEVEEFK